MSGMKKGVAVGVAVALVCLLAWFVWPTPWRIYTVEEKRGFGSVNFGKSLKVYRVNRITGVIQVSGANGWEDKR